MSTTLRIEAIKPVFDAVGATIVAAGFSIGEDDLMIVTSRPTTLPRRRSPTSSRPAPAALRGLAQPGGMPPEDVTRNRPHTIVAVWSDRTASGSRLAVPPVRDIKR